MANPSTGSSAPLSMASSTSAASASATPSRLNRGTSFRIPLPPNSPNSNNNSAAFASSPPLPSSPGGTPSSFQPGSYTGSSSGASRFGGLVQGFRRNRGHSTNRGEVTSPFGGNGPPSPPVATAVLNAFPGLAASTSLNDLPPPSSPYFEGEHGVASGSGNATGQSSSHGIGSRGFIRRGFGRKNTGGLLGGGNSNGGQRTPTGELPPPMMVRSRSTSQPSLPMNYPSNNPGSGNMPNSANPVTGSGSFFPSLSATPVQERRDPLAASTATAAPVMMSDVPMSTAAPAAPAPAPITSSITGPSSTAPITSSNANTATASGTGSQHIRLVPSLESSRSLSFDPVSRDVLPTIPLRIGRFTDRNPNIPTSAIDLNRVAFKSKVVSRTHAEIWHDPAPAPSAVDGTTSSIAPTSAGGGWFIRDLKSSSGTFLNHIRLSGAGMESRPFPLRDGDVLQLGVDYQGGTEEIYRCVKMRVELNRGWQRGVNSFNSNAMAQIRAFGNVAEEAGSKTKAKKDKKTKKDKQISSGTSGGVSISDVELPAKKPAAAATSGGVTDCCICLFSVTVYQALFIAPCSHIFHFKCIRPLLEMHHPGFSCPLCRTFADLEADVEQDDVVEPVAEEIPSSSSSESEEEEQDDEEGAEGMLPVGMRGLRLSGRDDAEEAGAGEAQSAAGRGDFTPSQLEANLETLRPGKKSPQIPYLGQFGSPSVSNEGGSSGPATSRGSSEVARVVGSAVAPTAAAGSSSDASPSTPTGRNSTSFRRTSSRHSIPQAGTPPIAGGINTVTLGSSSTPIRISNGDDGFLVPSAGDFDPDIRRSSIFVQGADGTPMQIPITGRSRPGSIYDLDVSDNGNASMNAGNTSAGNMSERERNRARSVKGLRMSTNSITSLRQAAAAEEHALPSTASPSARQQQHGSRNENATQYHDFPDNSDDDDDDDIEQDPTTAPSTARLAQTPFSTLPLLSASSSANNSPTSVFTAPLATPGGSESDNIPLLGSSNATSVLPDLGHDNAAPKDSTTPPSSTDGSGEGKGKAKQGTEITLPGGLGNMEAGGNGELGEGSEGSAASVEAEGSQFSKGGNGGVMGSVNAVSS